MSLPSSRPALQPWQLTRAAFHAGKNLHGSSRDPALGRPGNIGDNCGFFTTSEESYAAFYAMSEERNEIADAGDIYACEPPERPLDLGTDIAGARALVAKFRHTADALDDAWLDGKQATSPFRFVKAVEALERIAADVREGRAERHLLDGALRNAAIEHGALTPTHDSDAPTFDFTILNRYVRSLGYDAFITDEMNRATGQPSVVTVYLERPPLISHRAAVREALEKGLPVPSEVLADYPDLVPQRARRTRAGR